MLPFTAGDGKDTCVQEFAPSVDMNASPPATAQSDFGWNGSVTNELMETAPRFPMLAAVQVAPPSVLLNTPPTSAAVLAYKVEGFDGSITIEISCAKPAGSRPADEKCRPPSAVLKTRS